MNKHLRSLFLASPLFCLLFSIIETHACAGQDVIFTNITITSVSPGSYQYTYQIKNIGTVDIAFNQLVIQNYVSTDDQVGNDAAAGGSFIDNTSSAVLAAGETYNGSAGAYPFSANPQSSYPYLRANVYLSQDAECDVSNNNYFAFVEVTGIQPSLLANAIVNWNADTKDFTVNDWSGNTSALQYSVYASSGTFMLSGTTKRSEPTPLVGLQNGLYILYLSDGKKIYSKKIVY